MQQMDTPTGLQAPLAPDELRHESKVVGALPIINHFLLLLGLDERLQRFLPGADPRGLLPPAVGLGVLLRNMLVSREPLYSLREWCRRSEECLLGLQTGGAALLNDDRLGRCLDKLFEVDRAALMTEVVVEAVRVFQFNLEELHNDSTTITFSGAYEGTNGQMKKEGSPHRITHGHNKDHRPDLKQLLYLLTTTADGTVPVWCSVEHGNTTDDKTHIHTWRSLCQLVGHPGFLYVADSKLCTRENMEHIAESKGRFLTVLPRTRGETESFLSWKKRFGVNWTEVLRRPNARLRNGPDEVFKAYESHIPSDEGYRIVWIWSSQKDEHDALSRRRRLTRANEELQALAARMQSPRSRVRDAERAQEAAKAILAQTQTTELVEFGVEVKEDASFKQEKPGRPSKETKYVRVPRQKLVLHWSTREEAIEEEKQMDGIFALISNDKSLSLEEVLLTYKHQPSLERRFKQLKSVLEVMPVFLKTPRRIEALLFLYFLAILVHALIELQVRRRMAADGIKTLPLYPEDRPCERPTADRMLSLFEDVRCHRLLTCTNVSCRMFHDKLDKRQTAILQLLGVSPSSYFSGIRQLSGKSRTS